MVETAKADAVIVTSGKGARTKHKDRAFLDALALDSDRQFISSMCSGALILAAKGLLADKPATTYPTTKSLLETYGVQVVEQSFVRQGSIATAADCLAAQDLSGWIIEALTGAAERRRVQASVQPVGNGLYVEQAATE